MLLIWPSIIILNVKDIQHGLCSDKHSVLKWYFIYLSILSNRTYVLVFCPKYLDSASAKTWQLDKYHKWYPAVRNRLWNKNFYCDLPKVKFFYPVTQFLASGSEFILSFLSRQASVYILHSKKLVLPINMLWCLFKSFNVFMASKCFRIKKYLLAWIVCDCYNCDAQFLICCNLTEGSFFRYNVIKYKHFQSQKVCWSVWKLSKALCINAETCLKTVTKRCLFWC